jgi:hypothetical protein
MSSDGYYLNIQSVKKQPVQLLLDQVIEVVDSSYFSVALHTQAEIIGLLCFQGEMLSVLDMDMILSPESVNPFDSRVLELNSQAHFKCAVLSSGQSHFALSFDRVIKITPSRDPAQKLFDAIHFTRKSAHAA